MSAFSVTAVWPVFENGPGWLTEGVVLIVTERLPCATRAGGQHHRLVHDDRAGTRVDDDLRRRRRLLDVEVLDLGQEGDARSSTEAGMRTRMARPVERIGGAFAHARR